MDLSKVYVSQKDSPENLEEIVDDILNRMYAQPNTTYQWKSGEEFLFYGNVGEEKGSEQFIFLDSGSDGLLWDLNGGNRYVVQRQRDGECVDFSAWYEAVKEKFPLPEDKA